MKNLEVFGVRIELPGNQPIVLLREVEGERYLPIWIGSSEASAIAFAQQGVQASRPLTHDLMVMILNTVKEQLQRIVISELVDGVFHANLVFADQSFISARPSDAIAIALRMQIPIYCEDDVLDAAGVAVEDENQSEAELDKFREFLENINPEDFS